jgi:hypothetical protein
MSTIVTRAGKGSALTHVEVDANFTNLNTDKLQSGDTAASLTITSATINGGTITGITDLAVADGGTGLSTLTAGYIPFGAGTSAFGSSANLFWDSTNNRLGLGTTSPTTRLDVAETGATNVVARLRNSAGLLSINMLSTGDANIALTTAGKYLAFNTAATERMRIDSAGNVGIGTTNPTSKLTLAGADVGVRVNETGSTYQMTFRGNSSAPNIYDIKEITANRVALSFDTSGQIISLLTAGSERMRIDSSGNVGIGTTSPTGFGSGYTTLQVAGTSGGGVFRSSSTNVTIDMYAETGASLGIIRTATNHPVSFQTNSTERMRITSAGDVGIGTTTPASKLDVRAANITDTTDTGQITIFTTTAQAANVGGKLALGGLYDGSNYLTFGSIAGRKENATSGNWSGYLQFSTRVFGGNLEERMRIDSSGNVGIGTASPVTKLDIAAASNPRIRFEDTADFEWRIGIVDNTSFGFFSAGTVTERMRIDSSGNVGIGQTSPSQKLDIVGNASLNRSSATAYNLGGGIKFQVDGASYAAIAQPSAQALAFYTGNDTTERMRIHSSGGVSIGNTTDSGLASLNVSGSISGGYIAHANGTTAMAFGSDNVARVTPNATATFTSTVPAAGAICVLSILTSGTTSYTITFGTGFKSTGTLATGTVSARYFNITFVSDGTNLIEMSRTTAIT